MTTIYKYELAVPAAKQSIRMPEGAKPVLVGKDGHGVACIWALVDTEAPDESRTVWIKGTGDELPAKAEEIHIGSFISDPFVWHVFLG